MTGLSGQNNYLDASKNNFIALSTDTMKTMGVKPGDYVAITYNGKTSYGVVGDNSGAKNSYIGEMSYHFAGDVFGRDSNGNVKNGITKYNTGNDDLNKVNIMIAAGSGNVTVGDNVKKQTYTLDLNNDGVVPTTQDDIQIAIENNAEAVFGGGAQGNGALAPLFKNPPAGVSTSCTP